MTPWPPARAGLRSLAAVGTTVLGSPPKVITNFSEGVLLHAIEIMNALTY